MKSVIQLYPFSTSSLYLQRTNASLVPGKFINSLWTWEQQKVFQSFMDLFVKLRVLRHTFIQNTLNVCCWFNFHWGTDLPRHAFRLLEASTFMKLGLPLWFPWLSTCLRTQCLELFLRLKLGDWVDRPVSLLS